MNILNTISRYLYYGTFHHLTKSVIVLNNYRELNKVFNWQMDPILDRPDIYDFDYVEDVNERRIRDAESLATVMRNVKPNVALEIGTAEGLATLLMSINAPESQIYTTNILPDEVHSGKGGKFTTITMEKEKIGSAYRARNRTNVTQLYENTAIWEPEIGSIGIAFIDGCHDTDFVFNDTAKVLKHMRPGGFILWHDFNPSLAKQYNWIHSVCCGVEKLYRKGLIKGRIFHVKDSWTGIYQVPLQ